MTDIKVVIGGSLGDEGKGEITDYFASLAKQEKKSCIVVLSNGGSQRGHTVQLDNGFRHVFQHFGSGALAGADTYLPKQYIVNPMNYALEYRDLVHHGTVLVHPDCLITTPFDMIANQIIEDSRGDQRHGSCGVGIWETILRKGITFGEISQMYFADKNHSKVFDYLRFVRDEYFLKRISDKGISLKGIWENIVYNDNLLGNYVNDLGLMIYDTKLCNVIPERDCIIFENGQGLLLDQNIIGYGKNTTPSNTGLQNPAAMIAGIPGEKTVEVCYVSRTYLTRHGAGRFDTESKTLFYEDKTNKFHEYQGGLRFGYLDVNDLVARCVKDFEQYAEKDWTMSIAITHTNENQIKLEKLYDFDRIYMSGGPNRGSVHLAEKEK